VDLALPYLEEYDAVVFTMPEFVPSELNLKRVVFTNLGGVGSMEVNVFQRGCDVVIQKSLREGFGLVVSEALWKEKPVVAGRAGGIPMQFPQGYHRYLIENIEDCAAQVVHLLRHPGERSGFGRAGREHIRQKFLLPRLVRDELRLIRSLV
jgi:trehalose synthase